MTTQKKLDIIEDLFFDDIFDIWEYITEFKGCYPQFLYYANFIDYYQFVLSQGTGTLPSPSSLTNNYNSERNGIYDRLYQITKKLIKDINKQLGHDHNHLSKELFYNWIDSYNYV